MTEPHHLRRLSRRYGIEREGFGVPRATRFGIGFFCVSEGSRT